MADVSLKYSIYNSLFVLYRIVEALQFLREPKMEVNVGHDSNHDTRNITDESSFPTQI